MRSSDMSTDYQRLLLTPLLLLIMLLATQNAMAQFGGNSDDPFAQAGAAQDEFLPVEEVYQANVDVSGSNNQREGAVIWQFLDAHYLYRHGFTIEWIANGKSGGIANTDLMIDDGIKKDDPYFGPVQVYYNQSVVPFPLPASDGPIFLATTSQGCADAGLCYPPYTLYFRIDTDNSVRSINADTYHTAANQLGDDTSAQSTDNPTSLFNATTAFSWEKYALILLFAVIGGLILNIMPCVLPVLSMKVFQLANNQDHRDAKAQSLAYAAGVVLSFVAIAATMLGIRESGEAIGWGFQLQSPLFVSFLVYLFFALGLSMAGFFDIGTGLMGSGQALTQRSGVQGAFFTGVLAVVVASPCTAPFMGSALGFALTQPTVVALSIFAALGVGMALPIALISFVPATARLLPKPGLWMERAKQFFAFPLFITAIWLLWVLGNQAGINAVGVILIGCVLLAMAIWFLRLGSAGSKVAGLVILLATLAAPLSDYVQNLPAANKPAAGHVAFTQSKLDQLRAEGTPVFVDLTADWCITCLANESSTLNTVEVQQAFKDAGIVYMVGDWTQPNPEITALLDEYNRSGIPLYLMYPPIANAPAVILPQILSKGAILDAIKNVIVSNN
ncbi:Thiol:disulfide interchange protein DsbD [BD1-7 clade bacterium]|uniref:Thiol:disulfide interchange protein DsbD n=1 Tax=BD1-7 clade bacterium TaxID=2029982 RepID=A0A5S9MNB8_9GAMM|nr:Thiol:disulfide interchange protein DsbD [BD1-7 clade bacterium]CAA0085352.1 Thiol:disulfide interchange protein DsbD [BD1-7 clade bacterium]